MPTLYNDIDQHVLAWTRELIDLGLISKGQTDGRSIGDIQPDDLRFYDRCHFFSGIAGWDYALKLAGWPDGLEVWTGSCPCQSFSTAGKGKGFDDPRGQLWTQFHRLIKARRPKFVFGEQVEGAVRHGWLDLLRADLETEGYTFRAAVLGAHSAGADHIRQRIYWAGWLPDAINHRRQGAGHGEGQAALHGEAAGDVGEISNGLSDSMPAIQRRDEREGGAERCDSWIPDTARGQRQQREWEGKGFQQPAGHGEIDRIHDTKHCGRQHEQDKRSTILRGEMAGQAERGKQLGRDGASAHGGLHNPASPRLPSKGSGEPRESERGQRVFGMGCQDDRIPHTRRPEQPGRDDAQERQQPRSWDARRESSPSGSCGGRLPHPRLLRQEEPGVQSAGAVQCGKDGVADTHRGRLEELRGAEPVAKDFQRRAEEHPAQLRGDLGHGVAVAKHVRHQRSMQTLPTTRGGWPAESAPRSEFSPWADSTPILCRDGKLRRIPSQSHVQLVVNGLPPGMGAGGDDGRIQIPLGPLVEKGAWQGASKVLKGSGNAIVPQTAAMFIRAIMEEAICHS